MSDTACLCARLTQWLANKPSSQIGKSGGYSPPAHYSAAIAAAT